MKSTKEITDILMKGAVIQFWHNNKRIWIIDRNESEELDLNTFLSLQNTNRLKKQHPQSKQFDVFAYNERR